CPTSCSSRPSLNFDPTNERLNETGGRAFHWVMKTLFPLVALLALTMAADAGVLGKTTQGKPAVKRIDVIDFGPDGVLFIGDGLGAQIFAVQTADKPKTSTAVVNMKLPGINARLAAKLGAKPDGIEIIDFAVSPSTWTSYFAVRKQD